MLNESILAVALLVLSSAQTAAQGHPAQPLTEQDLTPPVSGDFAPSGYLHSDAPLYYSFTDAYIASAYRSLLKEEQTRFDPMTSLNHVSFDISWDEVAKYAADTPESIARATAMLNRYSERFLFGTDTVAPAGPEPYFAVYAMWAPVWKGLTPTQRLRCIEATTSEFSMRRD